MDFKKTAEASANIEPVIAIRAAIRNSLTGFIGQSNELFDSFKQAPESWKLICKKKISGHAQEKILSFGYLAQVLAESDYTATIINFNAALDSAIKESRRAQSIREALEIMDKEFNSALSIIEKSIKDTLLQK